MKPYTPTTKEEAAAVPPAGKGQALSQEHRASVLKALGMEDALPVSERIAGLFERGSVIAVVPPVVRGVRVKEVCPYTGLTHELMVNLRYKGYLTTDGEVLVPPFEGWWPTTVGGRGAAHVMIDLPELINYLHRCKTAAQAWRAARRAAEDFEQKDTKGAEDFEEGQEAA